MQCLFSVGNEQTPLDEQESPGHLYWC
jgi:hypothetical protein